MLLAKYLLEVYSTALFHQLLILIYSTKFHHLDTLSYDVTGFASLAFELRGFKLNNIPIKTKMNWISLYDNYLFINFINCNEIIR